MPSSRLRDFTRSRVLGALERLSVPNAPTALLLDDVTRRILSSACRMSELMEAGQLTLVDNIHTRPSERSTDGYMHVIYLVSPTAESIDAVIADYQEAAVYGGRCHILLSCRLPAERLEQLRGCPLLMRHVHTLRELNVPFIALQVCTRPLGSLCPPGIPLAPWVTRPLDPSAERRSHRPSAPCRAPPPTRRLPPPSTPPTCPPAHSPTHPYRRGIAAGQQRSRPRGAPSALTRLVRWPRSTAPGHATQASNPRPADRVPGTRLVLVLLLTRLGLTLGRCWPRRLTLS